VVVIEPIYPRKKNSRSKSHKEEVAEIDLGMHIIKHLRFLTPIQEKCYGSAELSNFAELLEDLFSATDIEDVGKENVAFSLQYKGLMVEHGIVSTEFLSKLRTEIALVTNSSPTALLKVPTNVLSRLMSVLEQQVLQGGSTSFTKSVSVYVYSKTCFFFFFFA
jgi:hypothetical protein